MLKNLKPIDIIIPVYNEKLDIVQHTVDRARRAMANYPASYRIILVDDGSREEFSLKELQIGNEVLVVRHEKNRGYGSALKTGILSGDAPWIAITDADGTYPIEEIPNLAQGMLSSDMVIGVRTGKVRQIPFLRRFPKKILNWFASYMAGERIVDLNSGLRVFTRSLCYHYWHFYPTGFSFTSTITMGATLGSFRVSNVSINYFKRKGKSSIQPLRDTVRFFRLVGRLGLVFCPMKIFGPVAFALFAIGFGKAVFRDFFLTGAVGNLSAMLMISAVQIFMIGLVAKLIVHSRMLRTSVPQVEGAEAKSLQERDISSLSNNLVELEPAKASSAV